MRPNLYLLIAGQRAAWPRFLRVIQLWAEPPASLLIQDFATASSFLIADVVHAARNGRNWWEPTVGFRVLNARQRAFIFGQIGRSGRGPLHQAIAQSGQA